MNELLLVGILMMMLYEIIFRRNDRKDQRSGKVEQPRNDISVKEPIKTIKAKVEIKIKIPHHLTYDKIKNKKILKSFSLKCKETNYRRTAIRSFYLYLDLFSIEGGSCNLDDHISEIFASANSVNKAECCILDCGAGKGVALNYLLNKYNHCIKCATGISIHPFIEISKLIDSHQGKLNWYFDFASKILPKLEADKYDLITDVWGAYVYSPEKLLILNEYYRILKPGARCYILFGFGDAVSNIEVSKDKTINFGVYLMNTWSVIFNYFRNQLCHCLVICKPIETRETSEIYFDFKVKNNINNMNTRHCSHDTIHYTYSLIN